MTRFPKVYESGNNGRRNGLRLLDCPHEVSHMRTPSQTEGRTAPVTIQSLSFVLSCHTHTQNEGGEDSDLLFNTPCMAILALYQINQVTHTNERECDPGLILSRVYPKPRNGGRRVSSSRFQTYGFRKRAAFTILTAHTQRPHIEKKELR
jgi:hypothetical protein